MKYQYQLHVESNVCSILLQFFSHVVRHFSVLDWDFFEEYHRKGELEKSIEVIL